MAIRKLAAAAEASKFHSTYHFCCFCSWISYHLLESAVCLAKILHIQLEAECLPDSFLLAALQLRHSCRQGLLVVWIQHCIGVQAQLLLADGLDAVDIHLLSQHVVRHTPPSK